MFFDLRQQFFSLFGGQFGTVQTVTDAHVRESLTRKQRFFHQSDGLGHIALQRIIFSRMNADRPVFVLAGDLGHDFLDDTF